MSPKIEGMREPDGECAGEQDAEHGPGEGRDAAASQTADREGDDAGQHGDDGETRRDRHVAEEQEREIELPKHQRGEDEGKRGLERGDPGNGDQECSEDPDEQELHLAPIVSAGHPVARLAV